jgi:hypothetical protein
MPPAPPAQEWLPTLWAMPPEQLAGHLQAHASDSDRAPSLTCIPRAWLTPRDTRPMRMELTYTLEQLLGPSNILDFKPTLFDPAVGGRWWMALYINAGDKDINSGTLGVTSSSCVHTRSPPGLYLAVSPHGPGPLVHDHEGHPWRVNIRVEAAVGSSSCTVELQDVEFRSGSYASESVSCEPALQLRGAWRDADPSTKVHAVITLSPA